MNLLLDNPIGVDVDLDDRLRSDMEPEVACHFDEFAGGTACTASSVAGFGSLEFDCVADEEDGDAFDRDY